MIQRSEFTRDTGAYKCKARNTAGITQDISTVFIEEQNIPRYAHSKFTF